MAAATSEHSRKHAPVGDPISATRALAQVVTDADVARAHAELDAVERRTAMLIATAEAALPIERDGKQRVEQEIARLRDRGAELLGTINRPDYQRMPTNALRAALELRTAKGLPRLALFSVRHGDLVLSSERKQQFAGGPDWVSRVEPSLPKPLEACYADVTEHLVEQSLASNTEANKRKQYRLIATFTGIVPADVRRRIAVAKRVFTSVHILAEVAAWKCEEREVPELKPDPLVVGFDGEHFWLVASFDLTPLERAIEQICAGSAPKA